MLPINSRKLCMQINGHDPPIIGGVPILKNCRMIPQRVVLGLGGMIVLPRAKNLTLPLPSDRSLATENGSVSPFFKAFSNGKSVIFPTSWEGLAVSQAMKNIVWPLVDGGHIVVENFQRWCLKLLQEKQLKICRLEIGWWEDSKWPVVVVQGTILNQNATGRANPTVRWRGTKKVRLCCFHCNRPPHSDSLRTHQPPSPSASLQKSPSAVQQSQRFGFEVFATFLAPVLQLLYFSLVCKVDLSRPLFNYQISYFEMDHETSQRPLLWTHNGVANIQAIFRGAGKHFEQQPDARIFIHLGVASVVERVLVVTSGWMFKLLFAQILTLE